MSDIKAKASGPLWARVEKDGTPELGSIIREKILRSDQPYRFIPGHGKVVPVELVDVVWSLSRQHEIGLLEPAETLTKISAAIRAAKEGEV